ncbi:MAG: aldehyde dehydrogenase [Actinobacteria bacterium]|nr:aldehyde dehydrogenase [Actinomycetota bacterium]
MDIDEKLIEQIVRNVIEKVVSPGSAGPGFQTSAANIKKGPLFDNIETAIAAAKEAQKRFVDMGRDARYGIVEAIKKVSLANAEKWAKIAVEETGMGRVEDKIVKNIVAAERTLGPEDLEIKSYSRCCMDNGALTVDMAPYGVIAAITPMTNPAPMIINNTIIMISAGNSVVFLPHPSAKKVTLDALLIVHKAIVDAGGPENLITSTQEPNIKNASICMAHKDIDLICATGGPAIVEIAMKSGKKVLGAGPGNPPVLVDDTADIARAAREIVAGASFDNNILCNEEKVLICMRPVADKLLNEFGKNNCQVLNAEEAQRVTNLVVKNGEIDKKLMGKNCAVILKQAGINAKDDLRLAVFVTNDEMHLLVQHEQLMPILPMLIVNSFEEGVRIACRVEHNFKHTAIIHSTNIERITYYAQEINTTTVQVNGSSQRSGGDLHNGGSSWTIAGATGEGCTTPRSFTRQRRLSIYGSMNFVK